MSLNHGKMRVNKFQDTLPLRHFRIGSKFSEYIQFQSSLFLHKTIASEPEGPNRFEETINKFFKKTRKTFPLK